jgi:hypothetical protein
MTYENDNDHGYNQGFEDREDNQPHYSEADPIAWEDETDGYREGYSAGWEAAE